MTLIEFRKKLCNTGRLLFNDLPNTLSSDGQYNETDEPKYKAGQEELAYNKHISECPICNKATKGTA